MKTNQLRAMMLTVMLVITTLGGTVWAQPLIVKGTVTDGSDGSPLVGCAVTVKGTSRGAVTNLQGQYRIEANKGETLIFSYIGFDKVEKVVFSAKMDVSLKACYRCHINRQSGKSQTPVRTYGCSKYGRI